MGERSQHQGKGVGKSSYSLNRWCSLSCFSRRAAA
jgi:hypothetical protein